MVDEKIIASLKLESLALIENNHDKGGEMNGGESKGPHIKNVIDKEMT